MANLSPKISVVGCGNVGMRFAYAAVIRGLARHVVLVDIDRMRTEGEVMDLTAGAPFISPVKIQEGEYSDIYGSDIVIVAAGRSLRADETLLELARDNNTLFANLIPQIANIAPNAKLVIVTNPVDVMSYAAFIYSGMKAVNVIGAGTVLDSARFRYLLGQRCNIDPRNVHAYVLGEHGGQEFPMWSTAMIGGIPVQDFCRTCIKDEEGCEPGDRLAGTFEEVRDFFPQIIARKGENSYGIGLALVRIVQAILNDESSILSVSTLVENYYISVPCIVNRNGATRVLPLTLNEEEQEKYRSAAESIQRMLEELGINGDQSSFT